MTKVPTKCRGLQRKREEAIDYQEKDRSFLEEVVCAYGTISS